MAMTLIWTGMIVISVIYSIFSGTSEALGNAAFDGASAAVELCLNMAGIICLWNGIMEIMKATGISGALAKLFRPLLNKLFPSCSKSDETMEAISANISANLLGLGNAATPFGLKAVQLMQRFSSLGTASNDMCMLIIINSASIQLIPSTVAGIRAAAGASAIFDILPAVWLTSASALVVGIISAKLLSRRTSQ